MLGKAGRNSWSTGALVAVSALAGCNRNPDSIDAALDAIRSGSAKADLQRHLDAHPQCAPVLTYREQERLLETGVDNRGAPALVAAGVIEPVAGDPHPARRYYRPTASGARWFKLDRLDKGRMLLCFGRRRVEEVSLVPDGDRPTLRYTFTLVDPAPWMATPGMRAAVPGVALAFDNIFAARANVDLKGGRATINPIYSDWSNPPFWPLASTSWARPPPISSRSASTHPQKIEVVGMTDFNDAVHRQKDRWSEQVHDPYAIAYANAYDAFQRVASEAAAEEKARADFFATIVSVMSCSVGIAALGESSLRRIVVRTGLATLGRSNTRAVANFICEGQQDAVVGFVFGRTTDLLRDAGSSRFRELASSMAQRTAGGLGETNPLSRYIQLQGLVRAQANHIIEWTRRSGPTVA